MREIKFRGRQLSTGKWIYGDLVHDNIGGFYVYPMDCNGLFRDNKVAAETIGQFTGLNDKNGNEIYEGDIVRCQRFVYQVEYDNERIASFFLRRKDDMYRHYFGEAMEADECEVIGTKFEKSEK